MKYCFFLCLVLCAACRRDPQPLPTPYRDGPNMLACKINGEPFVAISPTGKTSMDDPVDGGFWGSMYPQPRNNNLYVTASAGNTFLELYINVCDTPGRYALNHLIPCYQYECWPEYNYGRVNRKYATTAIDTGSIVMQVALPNNNEAMGTFAFRGRDAAGNAVNVTDGRFYYKLRL